MQNYRSFAGLTPAIKWLLIVNIVMWLLSIGVEKSFGIDLSRFLGLHLPQSADWGVWQYVTHMFMHATVSPSGHIEIFHIFFNMFSLVMFGRILESVWGSRRFLFYYFVCGVGAGMLNSLIGWFEIRGLMEQYHLFCESPDPHILADVITARLSEPAAWVWQVVDGWIDNPSSPEYIEAGKQLFARLVDLKVNIGMVGASGAIFGVLLAFGMLFPNTELFIMFIPVPVKAKYAVMIFALIELFFGIRNAAGDNIAHFAHLGGMIFGYILLKIWSKRSKHFY